MPEEHWQKLRQIGDTAWRAVISEELAQRRERMQETEDRRKPVPSPWNIEYLKEAFGICKTAASF